MDIDRSITFEISPLELTDEATYALRLVGTLRQMENKSRVVVLGNYMKSMADFSLEVTLKLSFLS